MAGITPALVGYNDCDTEEPPITEKNFQAREDLQEGISGRCSIDTTYENDRRMNEVVNAPRSSFNSLPPDNDPDKPWRNWK